MGRTTKRTWLFALGLVAIVATTAACGDDDDGGGGGDGEQAQQSTTTESTTTTIAAEGPPEWVEVAQDIENREADLYASPAPDRVGDLFAESCECYQDVFEDIQNLAADGHHVEGEPYRVVWVREEATESGDAVRLSVKVEAGQTAIVDRDGDVIDEAAADEVGEQVCYSELVRPDGPDGAYRVYDSFILEGCPEGS